MDHSRNPGPARHLLDVVVGEAAIDVVTTPEGITEHPGGSPANVAYGLGRLGVSTGPREQDLEDADEEGCATEEFPPLRLVLNTDTSRLYIAAISRPHEPKSRPGFIPVEQYVQERAQLFVEAFRAAR